MQIWCITMTFLNSETNKIRFRWIFLQAESKKVLPTFISDNQRFGIAFMTQIIFKNVINRDPRIFVSEAYSEPCQITFTKELFGIIGFSMIVKLSRKVKVPSQTFLRVPSTPLGFIDSKIFSHKLLTLNMFLNQY